MLQSDYSYCYSNDGGGVCGDMALFRRIRSPRELKPMTPSTDPQTERDSIVSISDPLGIDLLGTSGEPVPDLPPRNNSTGGGSFSSSTSYRRTQSSGATMSSSHSMSVKLPGHQPRPQEADYFAPSDLVMPITIPPTVQEQRNQNMHDKIMTLNAPSSKTTKSRSFEKLTDMSDYSVPFNVLQDEEREKIERGGSVGANKGFKRSAQTRSHGEEAMRSSIVPPIVPPNLPPDYRPPPPPKDLPEQLSPDEIEPSISPNPEGNYECPWDSKKFLLHGKGKQRSKTDLDSENSSPPAVDPYRSPNLPHHSASHFATTQPPLDPSPEPELPPLPPRAGGHYETAIPSTTHHPPHRERSATEFQQPPPPSPPVPESARPRAITGGPGGESYYCVPPDAETVHVRGYVNQPPLHDKLLENGPSYVNQPPPLPPRYKELVPPGNTLSHSPDIRTPTFAIDTSQPLEDQE